MKNLQVCIPTYKRPRLLELLIHDIIQQDGRLHHLIVIDGDPQSGEVLQILRTLVSPFPISYVPSNYGNLAYQRYLGWRAAQKYHAEILIYFDDDQRIYQPDVLEWLTKPMLQGSEVVGVGCYSRVPSTGHDPAMDHLMTKASFTKLTNYFGASSRLRLHPGELTPVGNRIALIDDGNDYVDTSWLQGRVMCYLMSAIEQRTFHDDLFALDQIRCGLGEDTFLSRRVGARGKLLYTFRAAVDHPNADTPKSYPFEAYRYAYAATYSRRFLNDHYRVYDPPTLVDRWVLVKSYLGNMLLSCWRAITKPSKLNFSLAAGTILGAIRGLTRQPTAKRLTPHIDWWTEAEKALLHIEIIQNGDC